VVWIVYALASALMKCYFESLLRTNNWADVSPSCVLVHELNVRRIKLSHLATERRPFFFQIFMALIDRLCGLVVRVLDYRFGGPGSIPGTTRFSDKKKKENK
jgi:hypothetical protein